jgi:hypothetical protein
MKRRLPRQLPLRLAVHPQVVLWSEQQGERNDPAAGAPSLTLSRWLCEWAAKPQKACKMFGQSKTGRGSGGGLEEPQSQLHLQPQLRAQPAALSRPAHMQLRIASAHPCSPAIMHNPCNMPSICSPRTELGGWDGHPCHCRTPPVWPGLEHTTWYT